MSEVDIGFADIDTTLWYTLGATNQTYLTLGQDFGNGSRALETTSQSQIWQLYINETTGISIRPQGHPDLCLNSTADPAPAILTSCSIPANGGWRIRNTTITVDDVSSQGYTIYRTSDPHPSRDTSFSTLSFLVHDPLRLVNDSLIDVTPARFLWSINAQGSINDATYSTIPTATSTPTGNAATGRPDTMTAANVSLLLVLLTAFASGMAARL